MPVAKQPKKVCPVCDQVLDEDGRHSPSPEEAEALVDATEPAPEPDTGFCAAFRDLALSVPPSVRKTALKKLDRCGIDPMEESDQVQQVLEKAHQAYVRKKERARESSARRRAAKKVTRSVSDSSQPDEE